MYKSGNIRAFTRNCIGVILGAMLLAGCGDAKDGVIRVSVIGAEPRLNNTALSSDNPAPTDVLMLSTAQGLVGLDATGQIEPGLAERWIVSDDGLSYIFRLRNVAWGSGKPVTADQLARLLRTKMIRGNNALAPQLSAVEEIQAVTADILEIRLKAPRPHFLPLLAQPEMALVLNGKGTGPYSIATRKSGWITLDPVINPELPDQAQAQYPVELRGESAALAVTRYDQGLNDAVFGGRYSNLAYARAINPATAQLRFDPAQGLFGLGITRDTGFLASAENRNAIAMAIDRDALMAMFAVPDWKTALSILPNKLDLRNDPSQPTWAQLNMAQRRSLALSRVAMWRSNHDVPPRLNIYLPDDLGSQLLFARISADMAQIGVIAVRVTQNANADMRLIDLVAPNDSATWYLSRISCEAGFACSATGEIALKASRLALFLPERAAKLQLADAAFVADMYYIPLASPLRWSLVKPRLTGFRANVRAGHPLNHLLKE